MIRGFFDETSDGTDAFIVAGWLSNGRRWQEFTDEWDTVLDTKPKLEYFKYHDAKTLNNSKSQFHKWSATDRDYKIENLARVIVRHAPDYAMCSVLDLRPFLSLIEQIPVSRKQLDSLIHGANPYNWCFHDAISSTLNYELQTRTNRQGVDFVFDENSALRECRREYETLKNTMPPQMAEIAGTVLPDDDKKVAGLQAADLLAGALLDFLAGKISEAFRILSGGCNIIRTDVKPANWPAFQHMILAANIFWTVTVPKRRME